VFAGATRISALEGTLENAGALSPAPAAAVGNDLYLRAVYVEAASEDPGLRRLYVSLEGGVNAHGSGGIADLASRVGELAGEQAAARGAEVMEVELTAELKGLEAPGFAWLEAITADSRLEHYDTLLSGHDPARRSLRLLSEQWARLGGEPPGAGARAVGGGSMACTGEEGLSFSLRVRSATLTEDLAGDTALRWVLTLRERAPAGIVCLPGALLDAAWLARLVDEGAVSEATAAQLGESIARVRDLQAAVHAVTGSPAREATLLDLDAALTALAAAVVESEGLSAQVRDQIAAFIGAARAEVARALEAHDPGVRGGHVPGDLNGDLEVNLTDPYQLLGHLFLGDPPAASLPCGGETADGAAAEPSGRQLLDFNGDGVVNLTDPLAQLNHLFRGGPPHVLGPLDRCVRIEGCDGPCR
jgi:hypothetical protein